MPTHRATRTTPATERAMTPDEAIDILSYSLQRGVRRLLELRAEQDGQASEIAMTGPSDQEGPASETPTEQRANIVMSTTDHDKE